MLDADGKAEADAVPVPVMDSWLEATVDDLTDPESLEGLREYERQEKGDLPA